MSNLNQVILQGNLVDDPKIMGAENNVARFAIACNTGFGDNKETTYVDCVAFGKQVGTLQQYVGKGKQVIVRGTLIQNRWEDNEGNKRSKLEVRLENINGFFFTGNANNNSNSESDTPDAEPATAGKNEDLF